MPFKIVRNDITKMRVDAIVNTANPAPAYGCGVDAAVYRATGERKLLAARKKIGFMEEGEVAITPGFRLSAKYIIHAVSPRYIDGESKEEEKLRDCYRESLRLAFENGCKSIAFPLIATGSFGYPKEEGMRIALDEINAFLLKHEMDIFLVVFDGESTKLGEKLYPDLEAYIDRNYVRLKQGEEYGTGRRLLARSNGMFRDESDLRAKSVPGMQSSLRIDIESAMPETKQIRGVESLPQQDLCAEYDDEDLLEEESVCEFLEENEGALRERMNHMADTFQQYLLYLIASRGLSNAEVYKRAIITKQLFSKIKLNPNYHPDKATAMRLCVGAKLNLDETKDLLARAGYALSPCDKRDIIFSFFIEHKVFDMIEIDIALEEHGLPCFIE